MFGSLLIPGICAMISQKPISLSALVILRDVLFYAGALIVTVIFLADGVFYPWSAVCCWWCSSPTSFPSSSLPW